LTTVKRELEKNLRIFNELFSEQNKLQRKSRRYGAFIPAGYTKIYRQFFYIFYAVHSAAIRHFCKISS